MRLRAEAGQTLAGQTGADIGSEDRRSANSEDPGLGAGRVGDMGAVSGGEDMRV